MSVNPAVYLDTSATTPVNPRVLEDMQDSYNVSFGNPSSLHGFGRVAKEILETLPGRGGFFLDCLPDVINQCTSFSTKFSAGVT
jgi:cysteine desulfurase